MKPVLDTCVLLKDVELKRYENMEIYIPIATYKELDRQKDLDGELGFLARCVHNRLQDCERTETHFIYPNGDGKEIKSTMIIRPTKELEGRINDISTEVKADDSFLNMRMFTGDMFELHTHDFSLYNLMCVHNRNAVFSKVKSKQFLKNMYNGYKVIPCDTYEDYELMDIDINKHGLNPNEYVNLLFGTASRLCKVNKDGNELIEFDTKRKVYKQSSLNMEQTMYIDALLDESVPLTVVTGVAGTAKTYLALAAALEQVQVKHKYNEIIIAKSLAPLDKGEEVGFLPGELTDKLGPQFGNYTSNLENLLGGKSSFSKDGKAVLNTGEYTLKHLMQEGTIKVVSLDSVLGASLAGKFVIVDEAQSLDFKVLNCLTQRVHDNSKLVLLGDIRQQTARMNNPDKSALFIANKVFRKAHNASILSLKHVVRGNACKEFGELLAEFEG